MGGRETGGPLTITVHNGARHACEVAAATMRLTTKDYPDAGTERGEFWSPINPETGAWVPVNQGRLARLPAGARWRWAIARPATRGWARSISSMRPTPSVGDVAADGRYAFRVELDLPASPVSVEGIDVPRTRPVSPNILDVYLEDGRPRTLMR